MVKAKAFNKELVTSWQLLATFNPSVSNRDRGPTFYYWVSVCELSNADIIIVFAISLHLSLGIMECNVFLYLSL